MTQFCYFDVPFGCLALKYRAFKFPLNRQIDPFMNAWGFEIWTRSDFEWSERGWFTNDLDSDGSEIRNPDHLKSEKNG